jgi:hypothetical protein
MSVRQNRSLVQSPANPYITCAHHLLVLNPDPADNIGLASWHGVRLAVRL